MTKTANTLTRNYTLCPPQFWATSTDPARAKREWRVATGEASIKYRPSLPDSYFKKGKKCAKDSKKKAKSATPPTTGVRANVGKKKAKPSTKGGKQPAVVRK